MKIAAGIVFVAPDGEILLLRRAGEAGKDNFVGHWALPGGGAEEGESAEEAAEREAAEELGNTAPVGEKRLIDKIKTPNGIIFHTFAQAVGEKFSPRLNAEHSDSGWYSPEKLPNPMHPAVSRVLGKAQDVASAYQKGLIGDNQPGLSTAVNTGMPMAATKKRKKLAQDGVCGACKGAGCDKCGGSGVAPLTRAPMKPKVGGTAFDMAGWLGKLAKDAEFHEDDHPRAPDGKFGSGSGSNSSKPAIKMASLKKTGGRLGSNEGGTYEGEKGEKFYVKKPPSKAHVKNERAAAALYQLAGARTLDYREVEGGEHVATELKKLEKKNISEFTPAERKEAAKDFAIHAWLSNWDAAGLGGDNQGVLNGKVTTLDVGGSLRFRAQGGPKGDAFGDKVNEFDTMRDKGKSPDAARLFAPMTEDELHESIQRVTKIPDEKIRETVGDDKELADRLIARKKDLAKRAGLKAMDALSPILKVLIAQDSKAQPEHTLTVRYDGDFDFKGLIAHMRRLGSIGASRSIKALDENDKEVPFGWDGDGADKILDAELDGEQLAFDRVMVMGLHREGIAFDRAPDSVRDFDLDGRLHVEVSNISKACVNPYLGKEIPKYKQLGLDPDKIYQLLRDPQELQKGASTFNNLPLLDEHVGVNAADHKPQHVIGSTGTDSAFEHPFLKNSLVVWANRGIKAIESKKKKQLSSAYRYRADMTPGDYEGVRYDGVMRDIVGNHVCLVEEGRAGPDVVVGDSANPLTQERTMQKVKLSALGTVAYGALTTFLRPQLAADAQIDLTRGLRNITAKNFKVKRPVLAAWISESVKDKLDPQFAQDGAINSDGLDAVLDMIGLAADDFPDEMMEKKKEKADDKKPKANDADMDDEDADTVNAEDDEETEEEKAARMKKRADDKKAKDKKAKDAKKAKDKRADDKDVNEADEEHDPETPEEMGEDEDDDEKEAAMDAQIEQRVQAGIQKERERMEAVAAAKEHVRPRVGSLAMAFDSAAQVYRKALIIATGKEPPKKADAETLKYAFDQLPPKDGNKNRQTYAMDSSPAGGGALAKIGERNKGLGANISRIGRA